MKITIDTTFKPHRVEIEGDCTIGELVEFLSKYYPDFTWKDVRIGGKHTISLGGYAGTTTTPWIQPHTTQPWPPSTIIGQGGTFTTAGPTGTMGPQGINTNLIMYSSETGNFTNAEGNPIQVGNLSHFTSE